MEQRFSENLDLNCSVVDTFAKMKNRVNRSKQLV